MAIVRFLTAAGKLWEGADPSYIGVCRTTPKTGVLWYIFRIAAESAREDSANYPRRATASGLWEETKMHVERKSIWKVYAFPPFARCAKDGAPEASFPADRMQAAEKGLLDLIEPEDRPSGLKTSDFRRLIGTTEVAPRKIFTIASSLTGLPAS